MKSGTQSRGSRVKGGNLAYARQCAALPKPKDEALGIFLLLADMLDAIASGRNMYMVVGSTKDGTAYSVSVKGDDAPDTFYGEDLEELNIKAASLL